MDRELNVDVRGEWGRRRAGGQGIKVDSVIIILLDRVWVNV